MVDAVKFSHSSSFIIMQNLVAVCYTVWGRYSEARRRVLYYNYRSSIFEMAGAGNRSRI